jgi:hypothetical protein
VLDGTAQGRIAMQPIMLEVTVTDKEGGGENVSVIGYNIVRGVGLVYVDKVDETTRDDVGSDLATWLAETWAGNEGV